jgi:hypothetical protein
LNADFPLWLPKGSVRSILALGIITAVVVQVFLGIDVPEWEALLAGIVVRDYFQSRSDDDANGYDVPE